MKVEFDEAANIKSIEGKPEEIKEFREWYDKHHPIVNKEKKDDLSPWTHPVYPWKNPYIYTGPATETWFDTNTKPDWYIGDPFVDGGKIDTGSTKSSHLKNGAIDSSWHNKSSIQAEGKVNDFDKYTGSNRFDDRLI